jgi:hypothetical protein
MQKTTVPGPLDGAEFGGRSKSFTVIRGGAAGRRRRHVRLPAHLDRGRGRHRPCDADMARIDSASRLVIAPGIGGPDAQRRAAHRRFPCLRCSSASNRKGVSEWAPDPA